MRNKSKKSASDKEQRVVLTMRKKGGQTLKERLAEMKPTEMSPQEKDMICFLIPEMPELPFPTREMEMAYGPNATEYVIPDDKKGEVLQALFPFEECPDLDAKLFDIHERKYFQTKEYRVIRERNRNMLVSPYYPCSGGMVVDWLPDEATDTFVQKVEA